MMLALALTLQQAIAALQEGRPGEAQQALQALPQTAESLTWLGAAQLDNAVDPEPVLRRTLQLEPRSWRAHMLLGVALALRIERVSIFRKLGLASELKAQLQQAAQLAPREVAAQEALFQFYAHAPSIAGGGESRARAKAAEIALLDAFAGSLALAQLDHDFSAVTPATPAQLAALALASKAVPHLRAAIRERPFDARLRSALGDALGTGPEAIDAYRAACEVDPLYLKPWLGLARTLRGAEARAALLHARELGAEGAE